MKKITVERTLYASVDHVYRALKRSDTLLKVTKGLVHFEHNFPKRWIVGQVEHVVLYTWHIPFMRYPIKLKFLGVPYQITFTEINDMEYLMRTQEQGGPIRRWDHTMRVHSINDYSCTMVDEVEIEAGWLTGYVAWHAKRMYKKRQSRWCKLLQAGEL